jgi:hypothetical protein
MGTLELKNAVPSEDALTGASRDFNTSSFAFSRS